MKVLLKPLLSLLILSIVSFSCGDDTSEVTNHQEVIQEIQKVRGLYRSQLEYMFDGYDPANPNPKLLLQRAEDFMKRNFEGLENIQFLNLSNQANTRVENDASLLQRQLDSDEAQVYIDILDAYENSTDLVELEEGLENIYDDILIQQQTLDDAMVEALATTGVLAETVSYFSENTDLLGGALNDPGSGSTDAGCDPWEFVLGGASVGGLGGCAVLSWTGAGCLPGAGIGAIVGIVGGFIGYVYCEATLEPELVDEDGLIVDFETLYGEFAIEFDAIFGDLIVDLDLLHDEISFYLDLDCC